MRSEHVDQMSIGEFASRSRLSAKALRLYDELGLLPPARVDEDSGYRFYEPGQLKQARLIAALRELQFPLAEIKAILALEPVQAAERVRQFWAATEGKHTSRRALATYLIDELSGKRSVMYEVSTREIPERSLLCVKRNVTGEKAAWAFGKEFIALLRHYQFPQIEGRAGAFFQIFWGEVSEDSDGPMEWCRPVPPDQAEALAARCPELTLRDRARPWGGVRADRRRADRRRRVASGLRIAGGVERPAAAQRRHTPSQSGFADHLSPQRSWAGYLPGLRDPVYWSGHADDGGRRSRVADQALRQGARGRRPLVRARVRARSPGSSGPNGAGKTTTLRMLLGLAAPTSGRALVFDKPYARARTARRCGSARCSRPPTSIPAARAATTCGCSAAPSALPDSRVDEVLQLVELDGCRAAPRQGLLARDAPAARARGGAARRSRSC